MHLLGKDILRLHCVLWPALLMAAGYEPPRRLFVHGYLTSGDQKMSKSLGNVIDPLAVIDELGADPLRFYLLREVQWGQDGSVTRDGLDRRYAGELANDLGNLVSRATAMIVRYRGGLVPEGRCELEPIDEPVAERFEALDLTGGAGGDLGARARRQPLRRGAPAVGARPERGPGDAQKLDTTLYTLADAVRALGVMLHAYIPESAARILDAVGEPGRTGWERAALGLPAAGTAVEQPPPLFPRLAPPARDRHPRAPRAVRRRARGRRRRGRRGRRDAHPHRRPRAGARARGADPRRVGDRRHPPARGGRGRRPSGGGPRLLGRPRVVAVGECGLDFYRDYAPHDDQRRVFAAQIEVANDAGLPLVIHTRAADDETFTMLEAARVPVVLHCFGAVERLDEALDRGYFVSFAGNVAYPKAGDLREAARRVPGDRILAETDAPYLAPPPHRGRPNQPAYVMRTLEVLAAERGVDPGALAAQIDANATRLFGL